ncbi:MAG: hypothetical protein IKU25_06830 [Clostridia bacterium]|nr:hypothetical protein [Clostridia bacterium]
MLDKIEVQKLIENGLKECLSLASLTTVVKAPDEIAEFVSTDELFTESANIFKVLEVANESGAVRIVWNLDNKDFALEFSDDPQAKPDSFSRVSLWRLNEETAEVKDVNSIINDFDDAIKDRFVKKVSISADGIKMPIPVSRSDVKNSGASFDAITLASRFATIYSEYKPIIKENIAQYGGTFLPDEFFSTHAAPRVLQVINSGSNQEIKKLISMLSELYDDGSNEVQQIICVTLLGQLNNDAALLEKIAPYMSESLKKSVENVNKYLASGAGKKKRATLFGN